MNILNTIVVKIGGVAAGILMFLGFTASAIPPTTTIVDVQPETGQITTQIVMPEEVPALPGSAPKVTVALQPLTATATTTSDIEPIVEATTTEPVITLQAPAPEPDPVYIPIYIMQQAIIPESSPQPTPEPEPILAPKPMTQYTLEVISPIPIKGLNREYSARQQIMDEQNYVELGLLIKDSNGEYMKDVEVVIEATNADQNKTLNSTGNVTKIYINGQKKVVPYYPFSYEFKTPGMHTIKFSAMQKSETITFNNVPEDIRPEPNL